MPTLKLTVWPANTDPKSTFMNADSLQHLKEALNELCKGVGISDQVAGDAYQQIFTIYELLLTSKQKVETLTNKLKETNTQLARLVSETSASPSEIQRLKRAVEETQRQLELSENKAAEAAKELQSFNTTIESISRELERSKSSASEAMSSVEAQKTKRRATKRKLTQSQQELAEANSKCQKLEQALKKSNSVTQLLADQIKWSAECVNKNNNLLLGNIKKCADQLTENHTTIDKLNVTVAACQGQISTFKTGFAAITGDAEANSPADLIKQLGAMKQKLETSKLTLQAQNQSIKKSEQALFSENRWIRSELKQLQTQVKDLRNTLKTKEKMLAFHTRPLQERVCVISNDHNYYQPQRLPAAVSEPAPAPSASTLQGLDEQEALDALLSLNSAVDTSSELRALLTGAGKTAPFEPNP